jgi:hypothetical protein
MSRNPRDPGTQERADVVSEAELSAETNNHHSWVLGLPGFLLLGRLALVRNFRSSPYLVPVTIIASRGQNTLPSLTNRSKWPVSSASIFCWAALSSAS